MKMLPGIGGFWLENTEGPLGWEVPPKLNSPPEGTPFGVPPKILD